MPMSKNDTAMAVGVGLLLIAGGTALASNKKKGAGKGTDDCDALIKRANQAAARKWTAIFGRQQTSAGPVSPDLAAALSRWAGIESSGKAVNPSRLDERGLMQAGPQSVSEGALNQGEWIALNDPDTDDDQQASIAIHYVDWLYGKAAKFLTSPPTIPVDQLWYAKLYHQRPVDLRDGHMHGDAASMSRELSLRWANDPKALHRLHAANVVAWNSCDAPNRSPITQRFAADQSVDNTDPNDRAIDDLGRKVDQFNHPNPRDYK